jgi:hypothetical protein
MRQKVKTSFYRLIFQIRAEIVVNHTLLRVLLRSKLGRKVIWKRKVVKKFIVLIFLYHTLTPIILRFQRFMSLDLPGHVQRQPLFLLSPFPC